jgi:hypothetical protein
LTPLECLAPEIWKEKLNRLDSLGVGKRLRWQYSRKSHNHQRYHANCAKLFLFYRSRHSSAFATRLYGLSTSTGGATKVDEEYDRVMEASIGPKRILIPVELVDFPQGVANLPLGIWGELLSSTPDHQLPSLLPTLASGAET